jgi:AcrR family transcriptional regulator
VSSNVKRKWQGEPLPHGRHKLAASDVLASQRERLLRGMLECVGELGYESTTVPVVVATARVSRNAFYELFTDKVDCFIAACDEAADELLGELYALGGDRGWIDLVRAGVQLYLSWWQERPAFSRAYFVGLPTAGERALRQRDRQYARFRVMFEAIGELARREQPDLAPLSPLAPRVLVLATTELIAEEVRAGRTDRLTELEDGLVTLTVQLLGPSP